MNIKRFFCGLAFLSLLTPSFCQQSATDSLVFASYNLMRYGATGCEDLASKNAKLKTVFAAINPDILAVCEMKPSMDAVNGLRDKSLSFNPAMRATTFSNSTGSDLVNTLYYNSDKLGYLGHTAILGMVRDIDVYRLYVPALTTKGDTTDLYCFAAHFKSSQGESNVNSRAQSAQDIADWLSWHPEVKRYIIAGDFNLYSSSEPAWLKLMDIADDPAGVPNGWSGYAYRFVHTQSPAIEGNCTVTGGMDDRFDFVLTSPALSLNDSRIAPIPNSYKAFGNDGVSYNKSLDCDRTTSVSMSVCRALQTVSDHLPVRMSFRLQNTPPSAPSTKLPLYTVGNPVRDFLKLKASSPILPNTDWVIYNIIGQELVRGNSGTESTLEINVQGLSQGVYVLVTGVYETVRFVKI